MRKRLFVLVLTAVLLAGANVLAEEQNDAERPPFVEQLLGLLQQEGWSPAEIRELVAAADEIDWDGTEPADPAVVALALELGRQQDLEPGERALMALELALTAVEMEALGYDDRAVARAALRGVRDAMDDARLPRAERPDDRPFGLQVRDRILAQLELNNRAELRDRDRAAIRDERVPSGVPDGSDRFGPPTAPAP